MFVLTSLHSKCILYNIHLRKGNENRKQKYRIRGKGKCRSMSNNITLSFGNTRQWKMNLEMKLLLLSLYTILFLTLVGSNGG